MSRKFMRPAPRRHRLTRSLQQSFEPLEERRLLTADPALLLDLGPGEPSSPRSATEVNGIYYFGAVESVGGPSKLWRSDGTKEGTWLVRDFLETGTNTGPTGAFNFNGTLYFNLLVSGASGGWWKSDGTTVGTVRIGGPSPRQHVILGDTLYFLNQGNQFWKSDGTAAGTTSVANIGVSTMAADPIAIGSTLYFICGSSSTGLNLWKSDGTTAGTSIVKAFPAGTSTPDKLVEYQGGLAFEIDDGVHGKEVWTSDGTGPGTQLLKDIRPGAPSSGVRDLTEFQGELYFVANDGTHGTELWKSDGTTAGTEMVEDLEPGSGSAVGGGPVNFGGSLYFEAKRQLWKTEGTPESTQFVAPHGGAPTVVGDKMYFFSEVFEETMALWKSDGTTAGTALVKEVASPNSNYWFDVNGLFMFVGSDGIASSEVWRSDGTPAGTYVVKDINPLRIKTSQVRDYTDVNGVAYFVANDGHAGAELWKSDGTPGGTRLLKDVLPGELSSDLTSLVNVNGTLYFFAKKGSTGREVWKSDGTEAGTVRLARVSAAISSTSPIPTMQMGGVLYFAGFVAGGGMELWRTDGTPEGTVLLKDINSSFDYSSNPTFGAVVNNTLYFSADDGTNGQELWKTDGTAAGTVLVKNILPVFETSMPSNFTNVNGTLYFVARDGFGPNQNPVSNFELWKSNGTTSGTVRVADIVPGYYGSYPTGLQNINGTLLFQINDPVLGNELWTSDGTVAGTHLFKDLNPAGSSNPSKMVQVGDLWYFTATDADHGTELWVTDGTPDGTHLAMDFNPGPGSSVIGSLTNVMGTLYFTDSVIGNSRKIYESDGTLAGTTLRFDIGTTPGTGLYALTNVGGSLYFTANDGVTGVDPWIMLAEPGVVGQHLFYNNSVFDGANVAVNASDDSAIAIDKVAYLPQHGSSTFANVSSYSRGINGVMVDLANLPEGTELTVSDFEFRVGNNNSPGEWALAPAPTALTIRGGAGEAGADRVTITWADGAIKNTWLQVVLKGNDAAGGFSTNSGLAESHTFYFGNKVGDSGTSPGPDTFNTTTADAAQVFSALGGGKPVTDLRDYNRDGQVSTADGAVAFANLGSIIRLELGIGPPAGPLAVAAPRVDEPPAASKLAEVGLSLALTVSNHLANPGLLRESSTAVSRELAPRVVHAISQRLADGLQEVRSRLSERHAKLADAAIESSEELLDSLLEH